MAITNVVIGTDADGDESMTITDGLRTYTVKSVSVLDRLPDLIQDFKILQLKIDQVTVDGDDPLPLQQEAAIKRQKLKRLRDIVTLYIAAKGL